MSTHPYIPLYVDDFEAATTHLTPAEDGIYNRLMRLCWRTPGCSVPDDDAWIARKIRLSAKDYDTLARPVIDEFFTRSRGRLFQKRLRDEYDAISVKKDARKNAGKSGGIAKARKTKEKASSNASVLPPDTRAFPEPYPEPDKEPPIAPKGADLFGEGDAKPKAKPEDDLQAAVDAIWGDAPKASRQRSGRADVARSLAAAVKRSDLPPETTIHGIVAGLAGYFASDAATKDGGAFVKGVHRMIEQDRWREFVVIRPVDQGNLETPSDLWRRRVMTFRKNGHWSRLEWGPPPGKPGCTVAPEILMAEGFTPAFEREARVA